MEPTVLLYYCYFPKPISSADADAMIAWQEEQASRLGLSGRVRVAFEGLNANLSGPREAVDAYCAGLSAWREGAVGGVDFKLAPTTAELEFRGLKVWLAKEVVALGAQVEPSQPGGRHVSPQEFHRILQEAQSGERPPGSVVLLDARNLYETRLGRFEVPYQQNTDGSEAKPSGPVVQTYAPPTNNFTELPKYIDDLPAAMSSGCSSSLSGKTFLMYCTGGVRCERASQYLRAKHPEVGDVAQLSGGIHRYLESYADGGFWRGLNYVFDRREVHGAMQGGDGTSEMIAACNTCAVPWASYKGKRRCGVCRALVLVCDLCQSKGLDKKLLPQGLICEVCQEMDFGGDEKSAKQKHAAVVGETESPAVK